MPTTEIMFFWETIFRLILLLWGIFLSLAVADSCEAYNGIVNWDPSVPVCCSLACGECRQQSCSKKSKLTDCCPNAINREDVGFCSDTQIAPCRLPANKMFCRTLRHGLCKWYQQCQLLGGKCYSANNDDVPCSAFKHNYSTKEENCPVPRCVWKKDHCSLRDERCELYPRKKICLSGYGAFPDELQRKNCVWKDRKCTTISACRDFTDRTNCREANDDYDCIWLWEERVCRDAQSGCRRFDTETSCTTGFISITTRELVECLWRNGRCQERLFGCASWSRKKDCMKNANWPVLGHETGVTHTVPCLWMKSYAPANGRSVCIDGGCEEFTDRDTCVTGSGDLKCAWDNKSKDCITLEDCTGFDKESTCLEFSDNMDCMWYKGSCQDAPPGCTRFNTKSKCVIGRDDNMSPSLDPMDCQWKQGQCIDSPPGCGRYLTRTDCEELKDWPANEPAVLCKWTKKKGMGKICEESENGCAEFITKSECEEVLGKLLGCVWRFQACRKYPDW